MLYLGFLNNQPLLFDICSNAKKFSYDSYLAISAFILLLYGEREKSYCISGLGPDGRRVGPASF